MTTKNLTLPVTGMTCASCASRIERGLKKLGAEQRSLLILHDVEGYSLHELETIMALKLGTIKSKLHRARVKLGLTRTYQQSRHFLGLTVEDSIYLSIVGVAGGRLRPVRRPRHDRELRERAREAAGRVAIDDKLGELVGNLSHGEHRQVAIAMALAANPRMLMLDEPASGLSRGERVLLTELLLALDPAITLILIEHDMDIALRVADNVTMMHDGSVIVEGTPDEIRANETVHDLYLGRGTRDE